MFKHLERLGIVPLRSHHAHERMARNENGMRGILSKNNQLNSLTFRHRIEKRRFSGSARRRRIRGRGVRWTDRIARREHAKHTAESDRNLYLLSYVPSRARVSLGGKRFDLPTTLRRGSPYSVSSPTFVHAAARDVHAIPLRCRDRILPRAFLFSPPPLQ